MYVKLHGGTQPGGSVLLELGTQETRILFHTGNGLPPSDNGESPFHLEGLTDGAPHFDGLFIAHPHSVCPLEKILPDIPVFAGNETQRVVAAVSDFYGLPSPAFQSVLLNCQPIQLGDFRVTPIGTDRGTKDAYMFLIQTEGKTVLYTGDYRAVEEILPEIKRLLETCAKRRIAVEDLQSGCYFYHEVLEKFIEALHPAALLPIHCGEEERESFSYLHDNLLPLSSGTCWEVP